MTLDDKSFSDPQQNLEYDDFLLQQAERGAGEVLRFWESPVVFVVLGRTCRPETDVLLEATSRDNIPVLRRSSGGGTVLQGPGCLNFTLVLHKKRDVSLETISASYRYILDQIVLALGEAGVPVSFRPVCDLALLSNDKKVSGNAQRRGRQYILHHGTLLYAFDLSMISRYLRMPPRMPDYRLGRTHDDFLTNVPLSSDCLRRAIVSKFLSNEDREKMISV